MVKVSVIMPVYNAEDFLAESIDCILNQTLDDLELICVDDGSADSSLEMLNDYAEKDSRVKVFHQENRGGGAARNVAIEHAVGEYIYCMDADDMIELDALEILYDLSAEKDLDMVIFQAINYDDKLDKYYHNVYYDMEELADFVGNEVFGFDDLDDYIFKISVTPWCKFYRTKFVKDADAKFAEGLIFHDNIFYWDLIFKAKRMYFLRKFLYIRRRHIASSTGAGDKRYISTITINNMIIQRFIDNNQFDRYKQHLYNRKISLIYRRYGEVQDQYKPDFYDAMKEDFSKLLDASVYDEFMELAYDHNIKRFNDVVKSRDFKDFEKRYNRKGNSKNKKSLKSKVKKVLRKFK